MTTNVTEIERAAITLLHNAGATNPQLVEYIGKLVTDPDFSALMDNDLFTEICDRKTPRPAEYSIKDWRTVTWKDRVILALAFAVASYRDDNRPDGDVTHDLTDDFSISTSLAAAVVEYHNGMMNWYAQRLLDAEEK